MLRQRPPHAAATMRRYLCPIGGMNGLFAKLSMTELRARAGVCSSNCSTYTCLKGGAAVGLEGLASKVRIVGRYKSIMQRCTCAVASSRAMCQ